MCGNPELNGSHRGNGGPVILDPPERFALYLTVPSEEPARPYQPDGEDDPEHLDAPDGVEDPDGPGDGDTGDTDAMDALSLAELLTLIRHDLIDPERVVAWGLDIAGRVLVGDRAGRVYRCASPESARVLIGRRLR